MKVITIKELKECISKLDDTDIVYFEIEDRISRRHSLFGKCQVGSNIYGDPALKLIVDDSEIAY